MTWNYCERWNKKRAKPIATLTENEARSLHEAGKLYTVYALYENGAPSVALEVRLENGFVGIWDFDRYHRPAWRRVLHRYGEHMFLEGDVTYDYGDSTELLTISQAERLTSRRINPDGTGVERRQTRGEPTAEESEISFSGSRALAHYWVPFPTFGDYDAITLAGIDPQDINDVLDQGNA